MKKILLSLALVLTLTALPCSNTKAFTRPGASVPAPDPPPATPSPEPPASGEPSTEPPSGDGGSGDTTVVVQEPLYSTYTPKITQLHNVNAMVRSLDGVPVYYIPTLNSIPVSLKDLVTDLSTGDNEHKFALVYDKYFDTEAYNATRVNPELENNATESEISGDSSMEVLASPDLYTNISSTPALKTIGYDLLLSNETYIVNNSDGVMTFDYSVTPVGDSYLTYNTIVMDLYKSLGLFKYDIKFTFGIDPDFDPDTSPILQELSVITSTEGNRGIDDSEANTYVAITRTNPVQYWEQFITDMIMQSPDENYSGEACDTYRSGVSKASNANLTYAEFFQVACSMLNLYGESALTSEEVEAYFNVYGSTFPKGMFTDEQSSCVKYLVAKGIVDPDYFDNTGVKYTDYVTYSGIEDILYRIANKDARLTIKMQSLIQPALQAAGYTNADITVASNLTDYVEYDYDTSQYYDFLIEVDKSATVFYAKTQYATSDVLEDSGIYSSQAANESTSKSSSTVTEKVLANSNLRLVRNNGCIGEDEQPTTEIIDGSPTQFTYMYEGIKDINGKDYYHFKVNPAYFSSCETFYLTYKWKSKTSESDAYLEEPYSSASEKYVPIGSPTGGVYTYNKQSKKFTHKFFSQAGFDYSFKDSKTVKETITGSATSDKKIISVGVLSSLVQGNNVALTWSDVNYDWSKMYSNQGLIYNKNIKVGKDTSVMWFEPINNGSEYIRLEILTSDIESLRDTDFYSTLVNGAQNTSSSEGYYRAEDGSLLVSFNYLKSKGLVTGLTKLDKEMGYVLTLGDYGTNVTIMNSDDTKYVIVGDTVYGNLTDETLVTVADNDYYINYRACLGWAGNYICVPSDSGSLMAMRLGEFTQSGGAVTNNVESVHTFFPNASTNLLYTDIDFTTGQGKKYEGFSMAGSYGLSPYTLVMADENNCDYLFVWHLNDVNVSGKIVNVSKKNDKKARAKFKSLTGLSVEAKENYSLRMFKLDRDYTYAGLKYTEIPGIYRNLGTQKITYGWVYDPPKMSSVAKALRSYANSAKKSEKKYKEVNNKLLLPIFEYEGNYYDANVNMCAETSGSELQDVGIMLGSMCTNSESDKLAKITGTGLYEFTTTTFTNDWTVYTAPVGMFADLKCMGTKVAKDVTSGALYFGTSKCKIRNNVVTVAGKETAFDSSETAICTFKGVGSNSIYTTMSASTSIGDKIVEDINNEIEGFIADPENLVDWGQYKFDRLTKNLDAWSTVALIFVLNILPRVALLMFFLLMILSLIKDVRPWKMFCERVFDVYSFLTLGHITVHSIDTKKVVLISLVCSSLFIIIMDGQLFNFIIFIAKFFIALYQR